MQYTNKNMLNVFGVKLGYRIDSHKIQMAQT